ncbi:hypothetical protein ACN20G_23400 [Streptomyces sp. BI20]|uniref:hypothetical protein n=1 Tax=Streptomyces sp. BI20 TaxID=3403460 RepID=UPI003C70CA68
MPLSKQTWTSRQKVSKNELTAMTDSLTRLQNPPYMRASTATGTSFGSEAPVSWGNFDSKSFTRKGTSEFVAPADGLYWVTAAITLNTPSSMTATSDCGLYLMLGRSFNGIGGKNGDENYMKCQVGSRVMGSYYTCTASSLMPLKKGYSLWASCMSAGDPWVKAVTGNPTDALSYLSAVLIYPDITVF